MRAFLFPGQGSQYSGMANDFSVYPDWDYFGRRAEEVLNLNLIEIMNGDEETLKLTENAQPAIYLASYVAYNYLRQNGVGFQITAGHSLGEYTAFAAASVYDFDFGIHLVRKRGEYISQAIEPGKGSMAAVLRVSAEEVEKMVKNYEGLYVANYNSSTQTVVSGLKTSIDKFINDCKEKGIRATELVVSGPFHTPFLNSAREKLIREIEHVKFRKPTVPIVLNSTGKESTDPERLKYYLLEQIAGPVYWYQSIKRMLQLGVKEFLEVGPKNVLSNMLKREKINIKHFREIDGASAKK
ncbi:malonyl CoA-ACP transacylase [Thermosipho melanesiensis]|uniref:Malonyl CoA-acyl carrier protein transacylase n=2 Tax=Thermosipho melanesiensis TaxID=46541 RepID=A6LND2_THEM4|nr:ACP S-malonyltransferase [Thermosipho melanesiensis]ABR31433.1 Acyl transferase [Thermosipho melanesiensis BI429]APT74492.1 malonyl CoA-ACP transacylase [Thermosipho melanesiensis]OOC36451.1 malonyl CoA-ACP transacylase [Thermosipho melanesiensis]OOC37269.1 malonyl CoA-ACP transacylase [Thermosipho melanesiensis]OOC38021.1 malonyl CoA-ACP transacylase [Thermosipho melanesiensis]